MFRSINEALAMLKRDDEGTAVTLYLIRKLCKENKIKFIPSGKKYIIDVNSLKKYLGLIPVKESN